jgi:hypothetical protein
MRTYAVRVLAVLAVLAGWSVGAPTAALASCAGREPAQVVADSDVVLTGRLTAVDDPGGDYSPRPVAWTVAVSPVHKGEASRTTYVRATTESPGTLGLGGSHVLALVVSGGELTASGCQDVVPAGTTEADALTDAAGPGRAPAADGTTLPGSRVVDVGGGGMTLTTMLVIALVGLLVVTFGGLALAIGLGLLTARRRNRSGGNDPGTRPDSTGMPFK